LATAIPPSSILNGPILLPSCLTSQLSLISTFLQLLNICLFILLLKTETAKLKTTTTHTISQNI
jgi:hypothetical protein